MQLNFRYLIAFLLLSLLVQEAHEIAHMLLNGMLQVCSGTRYFLYWEMCDADNKSSFAALALIGPFVNFILMAIGFLFLSNASGLAKKSIGFTLIMAANPLQRLQALIFRGSDEIAAFKKIFGPVEPIKGIAVMAGLLLTLVFVVPALFRAWTTAKQKNALLIFLICLVLPYVFTIAMQSAFLKTSLKSTLLETSGLMGFSWLVWLDIVLVLLFLPFAKYLKTLFTK
jgi:hypothetical protein